MNGNAELALALPGNVRASGMNLKPDELQTAFSPEGLQKRLLKLFRDSKSSEDEQGVNILYLAVGFLTWFEQENSDVPCESPLILMPVSLIRDNARSAFRLIFRDDDIVENLPLKERLREDFGIEIPSLSEDRDILPTEYFDAVSAATESERRWKIDTNCVMLGFFSFSKFLMFRDLIPENWPAGEIVEHPLIQALLEDGFPTAEPLFEEDCHLDEIFSPADLMHVVDADASQTLVIETVKRDRNLVVQGPPGTGKSQTITNMIAGAVNEGKRVLFLSEKMAALDVVYKRLQEVGLGDVCLELHSRKSNKRFVTQELDRTLHIDAPRLPPATDTKRLKKVRDELSAAAAKLNTPIIPTGVSPYRALGKQVQLQAKGYRPPELTLPEFDKLD